MVVNKYALAAGITAHSSTANNGLKKERLWFMVVSGAPVGAAHGGGLKPGSWVGQRERRGRHEAAFADRLIGNGCGLAPHVGFERNDIVAIV